MVQATKYNDTAAVVFHTARDDSVHVVNGEAFYRSAAGARAHLLLKNLGRPPFRLVHPLLPAQNQVGRPGGERLEARVGR